MEAWSLEPFLNVGIALDIFNFSGCLPDSKDKFISSVKIGDISLLRYLRRSIGILVGPEALVESN